MRTPVLALMLALGLLLAPVSVPESPAPLAGGAAEASSLSLEQPRIDVDIEREDSGAWYMSPVWLAIGGIALVLLVLIIAMAVRGGGTTVIRE